MSFVRQDEKGLAQHFINLCKVFGPFEQVYGHRSIHLNILN